MHSPCQFDTIKIDMKSRIVSVIFIIFFLMFAPTGIIVAQVKPDIRNYAVHVSTRDMPIQFCTPFTPEQWIRFYIGFNELQGDTMKFSDQLFSVGDQFERASTRLTPFMAKTNMNKTMDEPGNKPTWVGSICCYGGWCGSVKQLYGDSPIEAENSITTMFKQIRFGSNLLSAYIARDHLPMSGGTYSTQRDPLEPDPTLQSECNVDPKGADQSDKEDKATGKNVFLIQARGFVMDAICNLCPCAETKMWIKTDSMIQYNTDALCRTTGCTQEQLGVVAPQSRALPQAQESGGFINAQARPGLMAQIQEMVIQLFGSITGKVKDQKTVNNVNTQSAPSSYYTTEALEKGADFLNCKLFPYAKRSEMPECNTNWLANLIGTVTQQLQGNQNVAEPTE